MVRGIWSGCWTVIRSRSPSNRRLVGRGGYRFWTRWGLVLDYFTVLNGCTTLFSSVLVVINHNPIPVLQIAKCRKIYKTTPQSGLGHFSSWRLTEPPHIGHSSLGCGIPLVFLLLGRKNQKKKITNKLAKEPNNNFDKFPSCSKSDPSSCVCLSGSERACFASLVCFCREL